MNHAILKEKKRDGGYFDHPLDKPVITLGRSKEADIVINDSSVSRLHVRIENRSGHYYIFDNNSSNGTYVNKKKVSDSVLHDGDDIIAGRVQFYFSQKVATASADDYLMGDTAETPRAQLAETVETRTVRPDVGVYDDTPRVPQPTASPPGTPPTFGAPPVHSAPPAPSGPPAPSYGQPPVTTPPPPQMPPAYAPSAPPPRGAPPPYQQNPAPPAMPPAPGYTAPTAPPSAPSFPPPAMPGMTAQPVFAGAGEATSASPIHRLLAQIIDIVLIVAVQLIIVGLAFVLPGWLTSILSLLVSFGVLAYFIVGWMKFGKTLGKHFLGIEIVEIDHPNKIGLDIKPVLMRILGQILCAIPLYLGFLTVLFDPEGRGFHDKLAGTKVIKR